MQLEIEFFCFCFFTPSHLILFRHIHKPLLWPSPIRLLSRLQPQHPSIHIFTIPPQNMSIPLSDLSIHFDPFLLVNPFSSSTASFHH